MSFIDRLRGCDGSIEAVLDALIPGASSGTERLRKDIAGLARDPLARGALILGPAGCGKSTIARSVALCRCLAVLTPDRARTLLERMGADGPFRLDARQLEWYVEFSLPGLAKSVAEAQLFGFTPDVAAGGTRTGRAKQEESGRPSIFEAAALGRIDPSKPTLGARATAGVVFLDEVADLDQDLQPKLLTVLTGATVYRVGGEGRDEYAFEFRGLTLAATWRSLDHLRPDLLARLGDHVLTVPSLSERRDEIDAIVNAVVAETQQAHESWIRGLLGDEDDEDAPSPDPAFDVPRLRAEAKAIRSFVLDQGALDQLNGADWKHLGELRALNQVVRRIIRGVSVDAALAQAREHRSAAVTVSPGEALYVALLADAGAKESGGLATALKRVEGDVRQQFITLVRSDEKRRHALAEHLGMSATELTRALTDVLRRAKD